MPRALVTALALATLGPPSNFGLIEDSGQEHEKPGAGVSFGLLEPVVPVSSLLYSSSGASLLPRSITFSGSGSTGVSTQCRGGDALASSWSCSGDTPASLSRSGSGSAFSLNAPAPTLDGLKGIAHDGTDSAYVDTAIGPGQLGTSDLYFDAVIRQDGTSGNGYLWVTGESDTPFTGYFIFVDSANGHLSFIGRDVDGTTAFTADTPNGSLVAGAWYHVAFCLDRDAPTNARGAAWVINGVGAAETFGDNVTQITNDMDSDEGLALLSRPGLGGAVEFNGAVLEASAWIGGGLYGGASSDLGTEECDVIAAERFARLTGAGPDATFTRATIATLEAQDTLHTVGAGWPRVGEWSRFGDVTGYLSEGASTNLWIQSEDLSTSHTLLDAGDTIGGSITTPDGETCTNCGVIGDATDGAHGVTEAVTLTAASYTQCTFAEEGDQSFLYLSDDTVANADAYFDLSTCTAGTVGAAATAEAYTYGGWCRACITYTGTAAAHTLRVACAEADGDASFAGDGATVNCYSWGRTVEQAGAATTYIPTTTASVTRNVDLLDRNSVEDVGSGSLVVRYVAPTPPPSGDNVIASYNSGSTSNRHRMYITATGDVTGQTSDGGVSQATIDSTTVPTVGAVTVAAYSFDTNDFAVAVNGTVENTDVSGTLPSGLDTLWVGHGAGGFPINGVIQRVCLYDRPGIKVCP